MTVRRAGYVLRIFSARSEVVAKAVNHSTYSVDVIARLGSRNLIKRTRDTVDGRHNLLSLTSSGRRQVQSHARAVLDVLHDLIGRLSLTEQEQFLELMTKVVSPSARTETSEGVPA